MNPNPINQIEVLAAHTVRTYGSVGDQSYVTGHAAAMDARLILAVVEGMVFLEIYQCDDCGKYHEKFDLCSYCGGEITPITILSKRRKRGARK